MNNQNSNNLQNGYNKISSTKNLIIIFSLIALVIFCLFVIFLISFTLNKNLSQILTQNSSSSSQVIPQNVSFSKFNSEEEFRNYIAKLSSNSYGYSSAVTSNIDSVSKEILSPINSISGGTTSAQAQVNRYSTTNVQVSGIDEADIVKTDGKSLFLTSKNSPVYYYDKVIQPGNSISPIYQANSQTSVLNTLPVDKISEMSKIEKGGQLLVSNSVLVILDSTNYNMGKSVSAYDISDQKNPKKLWSSTFDSAQTYIDSRVIDNKLYIITSKSLYNYSNCVVPLLRTDLQELKINCDQIYYPQNFYNLDSILTVTKFDVNSGKIEQTFTTLAQNSATTIYMSYDNLYLTYQVQPNYLKLLTNFLQSDAKGMFPDTITARLNQLSSYDISESSKFSEAALSIQSYINSLNDDDKKLLQQNLANKMSDFLKNNKRNLLSTKIVKLSNSNLSLLSQGSVPGYLLNQYSLDEYQGNLRIATTVEAQGYNLLGFAGSSSSGGLSMSSSENDVYVLNSNLEKIGQLQSLGLTERIYSSRFINSKLYLVTFRQTDPFYIIDLSNPNSPQKTGELKIPGYSGYLHQLDTNLILGVGIENNQLKLSVFDVSDSQNPKEASKFTTSDYYSESLYNSKAFLYDKEKKVIFVPGSQNSYIFKLEADNQLSLKKVVSGLNFSRAVYVNNNLYLIDAYQGIKVFSEESFELVGQYNK